MQAKNNWINFKCDGSIETNAGIIPANFRQAVEVYVDYKRERECLHNISLNSHCLECFKNSLGTNQREMRT